jgi:hypothetical protein
MTTTLRVKRPHVPLPPATERANAKTVSLDALPDPASLEPGTLVIVNDETRGGRSLVKSVLGALGRKQTVSRAARCTALLSRGYIRVGAGIDSDTDADLCWGYVATEPCSDS